MTKFVPRVVTSHEHEKVGMNYPETSPIATKITNDTWDIRYEKIRSMTGYNTGRRVIKCQAIEPWLEAIKFPTNKVSLFVEGSYVYNCVNRQKLFMHFDKLKYCTPVQEPINFFSVYPVNNDKVHKLYQMLKKANYYLETKPADENVIVSIMPEMIVRIMAQIYDALPTIENVLILAQSNELVPVIEHLRNMGVSVTLAVAKTQPIHNYYLNQFDHIIDAIDFFTYANAIEPRRE